MYEIPTKNSFQLSIRGKRTFQLKIFFSIFVALLESDLTNPDLDLKRVFKALFAKFIYKA